MPMSPRVNPQDNSLWFISGSNMLVKLDASGNELLQVPQAGMAILSLSIKPKDGSVWIADQLASASHYEIDHGAVVEDCESFSRF